MRVLIACEESQTVCKAFRARGHEAYSCDIQEPWRFNSVILWKATRKRLVGILLPQPLIRRRSVRLSITPRQFRADYSVAQLEQRFAFEDAWVADGKKTGTKEFFKTLNDYLTEADNGKQESHPRQSL